MPATRARFAFGPFELDPAERLLLREGRPVALAPKAFDVLALLVGRARHLVTKDELLERAWPGVVVAENVLSVTVARLRAALGEAGKGCIEAVPGFGYRFVAPVVPAEPADGLEALGMDEAVPGPGVEDVFPTLAHSGDGVGRPVPTAAGPGTLGEVRALAVAPFRAHDPEAASVAAGLADALVAVLVPLGVAAHAAADLPGAGRAEGVATLAGDVQVAAGRARAAVRVGGAWRALWARTFTADARDPLAAQDALAAQAAEALALRLAAAARARDRASAEEAPASYYHARYLIERRMEGRAVEALAAFEAAVEAAPHFAPAWTGVAEVCALLPYLAGMPPREAFPRARAAAERALALDPDAAEPLVPLAHVAWRYDWDAIEGERLLRDALARRSDLAPAHQLLGLLLVLTGRADDGLAHLATAQRLLGDALDAVMEAGHACYFARRYDDALVHLRAVLDRAPAFSMGHLMIGLALDAQGDAEQGLAEVEAAVRMGGPHPVALATLACCYARCGRPDEARAVLADLERGGAGAFAPPSMTAPALAALGETQAALDALERAVEARDPMLVYLAMHPHFDGLRDEPRFRALALRVGLGGPLGGVAE